MHDVLSILSILYKPKPYVVWLTVPHKRDLLWTCGGSGGGPATEIPTKPELPLAQRLKIDGVADPSKLPNFRQISMSFVDALGEGAQIKPVNLRWAIDNDDRHIYFALEWNDGLFNNGFDIDIGPTDVDGVKLLLDNDGDGTLEPGEDLGRLIPDITRMSYVDRK